MIAKERVLEPAIDSNPAIVLFDGQVQPLAVFADLELCPWLPVSGERFLGKVWRDDAALEISRQ